MMRVAYKDRLVCVCRIRLSHLLKPTDSLLEIVAFLYR